MVLGPGGASSGYQAHRAENRPRQQADVQVDRMDPEEEKRLRAQPKAKRKKRKSMITANLSGTRYDVSKCSTFLYLLL